MPRSRTTLLGCILLVPTCSDRLMHCSLAKLERQPNQIISVLSSFNCSRHDAHHLATSETQLVRRSRTDSALSSTSLFLTADAAHGKTGHQSSADACGLRRYFWRKRKCFASAHLSSAAASISRDSRHHEPILLLHSFRYNALFAWLPS